MTDLNELRKQVQNIMDTQKPAIILNSDSDKKIREVEKELTAINLKEEFSCLVSELELSQTDVNLGGGKFKRSEYSLSWKAWEDSSFRLVLTNLPHNNSKLLIKTPEAYKNEIAEILETFLLKLNANINKSE